MVVGVNLEEVVTRVPTPPEASRDPLHGAECPASQAIVVVDKHRLRPRARGAADADQKTELVRRDERVSSRGHVDPLGVPALRTSGETPKQNAQQGAEPHDKKLPRSNAEISWTSMLFNLVKSARAAWTNARARVRGQQLGCPSHRATLEGAVRLSRDGRGYLEKYIACNGYVCTVGRTFPARLQMTTHANGTRHCCTRTANSRESSTSTHGICPRIRFFASPHESARAGRWRVRPKTSIGISAEQREGMNLWISSCGSSWSWWCSSCWCWPSSSAGAAGEVVASSRVPRQTRRVQGVPDEQVGTCHRAHRASGGDARGAPDRDVIGASVVTDEGTVLGTVTVVVVSLGRKVEAVGYELTSTGEGGRRVFIPLPEQLSVSGDALMVPAGMDPFVRDDLTGFGGAAEEFRTDHGVRAGGHRANRAGSRGLVRARRSRRARVTRERRRSSTPKRGDETCRVGAR